MLVASLERRLEQIPVKSCVGSLAGEETGTDSRQELCWQPRWGGDWNRFPSRAVLAASLGRILDQIPVKSCVGSLAGEDTGSDSRQELCWQPRWRNSCPSPRPQISTYTTTETTVWIVLADLKADFGACWEPSPYLAPWSYLRSSKIPAAIFWKKKNKMRNMDNSIRAQDSNTSY